MKQIKNITILHLNPNNQIKAQLESNYKASYPEAIFEIYDLSEHNIKNCIGCWNCWVKTPGRCVHKDKLSECYFAIINTDICVFSHEVKNGFLSGNSKTCMDRLIPLFHPHIKIVNNEMMHYERYDSMPQMHYAYSLAPNEKELTQREINCLEGYFFRCNEHFRAKGMIHQLNSDSIISSKDTMTRMSPIIPEKMKNMSSPISSSSKIAIYNGSPRGIASNTSLLVEQFKKGLLIEGILEEQIEVHNLNQTSKHEEIASKFYDVDYHMFIMPLYVHSMPGIVKHFIDTVESNASDNKNIPSPKVEFFVQSGFKEGYQSFYCRAALETICIHNSWIYSGCGIKGGMEGLRLTPEKANAKLYSAFNELGSYFAKNGYLPYDILDELIKPVHLTKSLKLAFTLLPNKLIQLYWDSQMKKNKVIDQSYAQPYKK